MNRSIIRASLSLEYSAFVYKYNGIVPCLSIQNHNYNCIRYFSTPFNTMASHANNNQSGARYRVSSSFVANQEKTKWVRISFDEMYDTTSSQNAPPKKQKIDNAKSDSNASSPKDELSTIEGTKNDSNSPIQSVPESVLQYQRQMRKIQASDRASKTNVNIQDHLHTIYSDDDIVVTNKPSGILCVPGVNKYKSLLDLVYEVYGNNNAHDEHETKQSTTSSVDDSTNTAPPLPRDSMIVHRLDMDTSGIVIFARTRLAMSKLHESFRERTGTKKIYEALLVGWLDIDKWIENESESSTAKDDNASRDKGNRSDLGGGEINLPLQRDHRHPPFMRVSTLESEAEARLAVKDLNHAGYKKLIAKKPKPSTTKFRILSHEQWQGHPVTRVELTPITGRTHQLRVHCAALGHPILGDPAYGFCGEAHPNGGFTDEIIHGMSHTCASFELRRDVEDAVRVNGRTMCLHARRLTVDHPVTKEQVSFEAASNF